MIRQDDNLLPDYMLQANSTLCKFSASRMFLELKRCMSAIGDASGTAVVVAAYYRFVKLCPWQVNNKMNASASNAFDGVVAKISSDGWLTQVC